MLRPYRFPPRINRPTVRPSDRPTVRPSDPYQLNMYRTPSCIRQTSSVLTFFWNE